MLPPGKYDPKRVDDLLWYLIQDLRRTMGDRGQLENDWVHYEELYRADSMEWEDGFPFDGASRLEMPVVATDVDTLFARTVGMLVEPPNLWSITAQRPELIDFAASTNEFLEWAQHNELNVHGWLGDWIIDIHKLGTGILKQRYTREMKKVYEWRELDQQTWQQQAVIMLKDHPSIHHVRLHDFFLPAGFKNHQQAPWNAERVRMTWPQFMARVKQGIYMNADKIGAFYFSPPINQVQRALDEISKYPASVNQQMEFYEFWLDFDIDGDGWDEALICTIHLDSQTYVRLDFNPFFNQDKPYSAARFMRDVNSFYGIGLGEMLSQFQEEISAMHNQRIDDGTIANSTQYVMDKGETHIKVKEPVFPSKIWKLNNPGAFKVLEMGSGTSRGQSASIQNEEATRGEAQRRTGVNDYVSATPGPEQAYGTAFTTQQMLLNSSKRFGETYRDIQNALGETGTRVLELYQQYNPRGKEFIALGPEDGMNVAMVLRFPLDLIRKGLLVSVTAIDVQTSKDAQIRTQTLIMQQLMQFYQNYMMMLSYTTNPQVGPAIQQAALTAAQGSGLMMTRLLKLQGIQDADTLIPVLQEGVNAQQRTLQNIQSLLSPPPIGGGAGAQPMAPGSQGPSGMAVPMGAGVGAAAPAGLAQAQQFGGPNRALSSAGSSGYVR
jgi:hypothetical protein